MAKSLTEALHETAQDFYDAGVMSEQTMREFDAMCLPEIKEYTPNQIKQLRRKNKISQAVFAAYLNTVPSTVQKWEQGQKKPSKFALKLLSLVDRYGIKFLAA
ncbi:helix-turn-helix domain-containing protein [Piscirickettsia litoralis]|uniref:Transcriptional regulator n=1 Tax=Piscirickettsia litoralis TaxID=1891921 RepID=A0ABX2ZY70_9GAMM|nr:DNA-binding transcriptional regulator [Piscirickettsia litoralis]ODN41145.1 transcriptional regulator [Piscirickettsia litoralis]